MIDACLFEPGLWQEDAMKPTATEIPSNKRKVFATPLGLIINELVHSPHIILESVEKMLSDCLDWILVNIRKRHQHFYLSRA